MVRYVFIKLHAYEIKNKDCQHKTTKKPHHTTVMGDLEPPPFNKRSLRQVLGREDQRGRNAPRPN